MRKTFSTKELTQRLCNAGQWVLKTFNQVFVGPVITLLFMLAGRFLPLIVNTATRNEKKLYWRGA